MAFTIGYYCKQPQRAGSIPETDVINKILDEHYNAEIKHSDWLKKSHNSGQPNRELYFSIVMLIKNLFMPSLSGIEAALLPLFTVEDNVLYAGPMICCAPAYSANGHSASFYQCVVYLLWMYVYGPTLDGDCVIMEIGLTFLLTSNLRNKRIVSILSHLKKWPISGLFFLYFRLFNTVGNR